MKKNLIVLFVSLCLISCKNTTYRINGSVDLKSLNGKTIFIKERINREWITIDSTTIVNGQFTFQGKVDTAKIANIVFEKTHGKRVKQAFVLENGKISVTIDTLGFMTFKGTAQNDLFQKYQNEKNVFNTKEEAYYKANHDSIKTPQQKAAFDKEMDRFNAEEVAIDKKFATENVNTLVGNYVFMNSFYGYTLAEKEAVLKLMTDQSKSVKRIQEIMADMETEKKVAVGNQFVDFKLPTLVGGELALSDLVGKTDFVLVDFWASWCGPCMQFLPDLQDFYAKHKGTQLEILGVSLDDNKDAWVGAVKAHKIEWKLVSDLKGWKCTGSRIYAVNSIPSTVLIDRSGRIVGKNLSITEMERFLSVKVGKK